MRTSTFYVGLICGLASLWYGGFSSAAQEATVPFRVCAVAGTAERPWVGVVWTNDDAAFLLKPGDTARGFTLKSVEIAEARVVFSAGDREVTLTVASDPAFAERNRAEILEGEESESAALTMDDFLDRYAAVVLADGTRLDRPAGGWPREPVTYEDFVRQYEHLVEKGLDPVDEELAARMRELGEERARELQRPITPEELERQRLDALRQMAEFAGMLPPSPEDLKPVTREEFLRRHGFSADSAEVEGVRALPEAQR